MGTNPERMHTFPRILVASLSQTHTDKTLRGVFISKGIFSAQTERIANHACPEFGDVFRAPMCSTHMG